MAKMLIEFDKAGAEWVIVAYMSGDARMLEVVRSGESPHVVTGHYMTNAPKEYIIKEASILGEMTDATEIERLRREHLPEFFEMDLLFRPRIFSIRQMGKKSNHGLNYIMKARRFSEETEMEERDCKRVIDLYTKRVYPGVPLWWNEVKRLLKENDRTLFNPFGRKRRFLEEWGEELFKQAVAYLPQSTNVDMVNQGMRAAYADHKLTDKWDLLAQVHDSLLWQTSADDWKRIAADCHKIDKYMTPKITCNERTFTVGTEMKIGPSWGRMRKVAISNDLDKMAKDIREAWGALTSGKKAA